MSYQMSSDLTLSPHLPRVIVPQRYVDDRGWFSETFNEQQLRRLGIACHFVQDNQALSRRAGTVRGFHFQRPPAAQAKLVSVLQGRILDIAVDIRLGSPSFGKHISTELSAENGRQFFVPEGFAHGYVSLLDDVLVMYKVSNLYAPAHEDGIRWNDPDIGFPWPFADAKIITSDKDAKLRYLKEFNSPFPYDGHPLAALADAGRG